MSDLETLLAINRPTIHMIRSENATLSAMTAGLEKRNPALAELLYSELDRAELCSPEDMPTGTVTMNCHVEFVDDRTGVSRTVQLVFPNCADIEQGRISILTPIGAGLIGMTAGESISWPDRSGANRLLKIVGVKSPAVPIEIANSESPDNVERR